MKIRYYGLNSFIIEKQDLKIVIDPGAGLFLIKPYSLIPKSEWKGVTHILVTHGDLDHFSYAVSMAKKTEAKIICGEELAEELKGVNNLFKIDVDEVIDFGELRVKGIKTTHGSFKIKLGWGLFEMKLFLTEGEVAKKEIFIASKRAYKKEDKSVVKNHGTIKLLFGLIRMEKDNVNFARGSIGFKIMIGEKEIVNLGDTVFEEDWKGLTPDLLMIPIGGVLLKNNIGESKALEGVKTIKPKKVVPCHYDYFIWGKNIIPADKKSFKEGVEKMGIECILMKEKKEITL